MLILALLALFAGPGLYLLLRRVPALSRGLDVVVIVLLAITLAWFLLPHLWQELGAWSLAWVSLGYLLPGVLERLIQRAAATMHLTSVVLAVLGLLAHAALDGAGLIEESTFGASLAAAIILHRVGAGLMIWMIVEPVFGPRPTWALLVLMALATIAGYFFAQPLLTQAHQGIWPVIAGVITGMIGHALVHRGHIDHDHAHES